MWGLYILYTQKLFSTRREIESQLHYRFINSINLFNIFIFNNSTIISKMVIDCTSLHSPHSLETGSKLKYSLLRVLHINGALPHLLWLFKCIMMVYGSPLPLCTSTVFIFQRWSIIWKILVFIQVFLWISLPLTVLPFFN